MRETFVFLTGVCLAGCIGDLPGASCPEEGISFSEDVTYLVARDCARCHSKGEDGVRLRGEPEDYSEIRRYVVPYSAGRGKLLAWAAGDLGWHPASWPRASGAYACVATWINEGACERCEQLGDDVVGSN